jgi:hypothetical protein
VRIWIFRHAALEIRIQKVRRRQKFLSRLYLKSQSREGLSRRRGVARRESVFVLPS